MCLIETSIRLVASVAENPPFQFELMASNSCHWYGVAAIAMHNIYSIVWAPIGHDSLDDAVHVVSIHTAEGQWLTGLNFTDQAVDQQ